MKYVKKHNFFNYAYKIANTALSEFLMFWNSCIEVFAVRHAVRQFRKIIHMRVSSKVFKQIHSISIEGVGSFSLKMSNIYLDIRIRKKK